MATKNWSKVSIGLIVFGFINFVLFIALSEPFGFITGLLETQANQLGIGSDVTPFLTMLSTIFGLTFVFSMVGLVIWFFLGGHEEEGEEYPEKYYYK